ncbi:T9SS type B sorting domain-containing protein, partial [Lentimicrobium saccharophilum]|uniref:T9SS type B sorting domain-containing protein n=1 Tax=Lentimicrobium saccharophilum TaxID=1678841 RepID=UPI000AFF1B94
ICEGSSYSIDATVTDAATITWTSSGTGSFSNATIEDPTYTPSAADILNGTVTLTLTVTSATGCVDATDFMVLTINPQAIVSAGDDATICEGSTYTLSTATATDYTSLLWTSSGTGTFDDATILAATYTPSAADIAAGSVTLTLTAQSAAPCVSATDAMVLTISLQATADAGTDATICEGSSYTLTTASATNATLVNWSSNGTGSFDNVNLVNATYTPSAADILNGSVILTMTVTSASPCVGDTDQMTLTINPQALVSAGTDATICEGSTYTLSTATATDYTSLLWTSSGTGTFDDASILAATYTPSAADIAAGSVILTLTAQSAAPCVSATDDIVLTISLQATADAGIDATICESDGSYFISDATTTNAASILWITSGTGSFSNPTAQNPIYTPSQNDIDDGFVYLTMTANSVAPCANAIDQMTLFISRNVVVNAGSNANICEGNSYILENATAQYASSIMWTTSGTGYYTDPTILNAEYNPSADDIASGTVILTLTGTPSAPCLPGSDFMVLTIDRQAVANAGPDATICGATPYHLSGATAINHTSVIWSTSGTGSFNSPFSTNPVYTPSQNDIDDGSVVLTMTAISTGVCATDTDDMTLTILAPVTVNAGEDALICEGSVYQVTTASAVNTTGILWTTDGTGTFDDATIINPVYTPSMDDIASGIVTLTLTGIANAPCTDVTDQMVINISRQTIVTAGDDATICEGSSYELNGATAIYQQSVLWTSSGSGFFSNAGAVNPSYTPSISDIINGSVILTITGTSNSPCAIDQDQMLLTISRQAYVNAGPDAATCGTEPYAIAGATAGNFISLLWTTSGTGSFNDATLLNPVYTPGAGDLALGTVTLTLTAQSDSPCVTSTDSMVLNVILAATASAGDDATICEGNPYTLNTAVVSNATTVLWTTSGTGFFADPTVVNATYTPSASDILNGIVVLTVNAYSAAPCTGDSDSMTLFINDQATVSAGPDASSCGATPYLLSGATASDYTSLSWTTSGTGTFSDATALNPVYTPSAADVASGSVVLTLTATSTAPCATVSDAMTLTLPQQASANAGEDATICEGSTYTLSTAVASNATGVLWTTSGTGSYNNATLQNPTYTPSASDILNGSVTLTMTVTSAAPCGNSSDQMVLSISQQAVVNAGPDASICEGETHTLSGATATNVIGVLWTTSGTGTFSDPTAINPVYTPSLTDLNNGSVVLTITGTSAAPCGNVSDFMVLTLSRQAIANAGPDATICAGGSYTLSGASALFETSVFWTTSGTGTFSSQYMENPTYYPSQNDIDDGQVILSMTAYSDGTCPSSTDQMILTISNTVTVNAGSDVTICEGSVHLLLDASATNTTSLLWTTSGTGTFDDPTILNAVYTPSLTDIVNGIVVLTLTGQAPEPCQPVSDEMVLTIYRQTNVNAGDDAAICEGSVHTLSGASAAFAQSVLWTTNGSGTFSNAGLVNTVYTPSAADILNGSVVLTITGYAQAPCQNSQDAMVLTITKQAIVDAGENARICENETLTLSDATAGNAVSLLWTSNGDGSFDDATLLNAIYTPGTNDIITGSVMLTLTAQSAGNCVPVSDQMILWISRQAIVTAGDDANICEGGSFTLTGGSAQYHSSVYWTTSGTGIFNNPNIQNPVYTPSVSDIANGQVVLTITAESAQGCAPAVDQMVLTFSRLPYATAGPDMAICQNEQFTILMATATNYSEVLWTTTGSGTLLNANTLNPTYIPGINETGLVEFTLTAIGEGGCSSLNSTDKMLLTIYESVVVDAGEDQTIAFNTNTMLEVVATGGSGAYAFNWQPSSLLYYANTSNPVTRNLTDHTRFYILVTDLVTGCQSTDSVMVFLEGINYPPVAIDDYDTTAFEKPITINILANDSDPENGALSVGICANPVNGLVVVNSNGTITYTPYAGYSGADSICYRICDKGEPMQCAEAMVYIQVMPEPQIEDLVIYNGVSPNGDGMNDTWKIKGIEGFPDNEVKIFNRWGTKIWESRNYDNDGVAWDATNKRGDRVPDGTYYYILEIKDVKTFTGWIYVRSED